MLKILMAAVTSVWRNVVHDSVTFLFQKSKLLIAMSLVERWEHLTAFTEMQNSFQFFTSKSIIVYKPISVYWEFWIMIFQCLEDRVVNASCAQTSSSGSSPDVWYSPSGVERERVLHELELLALPVWGNTVNVCWRNQLLLGRYCSLAEITWLICCPKWLDVWMWLFASIQMNSLVN